MRSKIPVDGYVISDPEIREPFIFIRYVEALLREAELKTRCQVQQRLDALQASILHEENSERIAELRRKPCN